MSKIIETDSSLEIHDKMSVLMRIIFLLLALFPLLATYELLFLPEWHHYLNPVKYGPESRNEPSRMISLLTNTETYFFREESQLNVFRDFLLQEFREENIARNEKRIKILIEKSQTIQKILKHLNLWQPQAHSPPISEDNEIIKETIYDYNFFDYLPS